jgi:glycosyltransferase involved in cell wall biosynthesis
MVSRWLYTEGVKRGLSDMVHIPIAVDHHTFHPGKVLDRRPPSVLGMYNPSAWKGGQDLITAVIRLRELYPSVPILLFGTVSRPAELPQSIDYVQNPFQVALANFYRTYAIFIHTSYREGWALPPAEAMASGCVFVGTDSRGNRDYAVHGMNALLVEPGDVEGLVRNVSCVIDNTELQKDLQEEGVRTMAKFQWEGCTDELEKYFLSHH